MHEPPSARGPAPRGSHGPCVRQPGVPKGPGPRRVPGSLLLPGARPRHSCPWLASLVLSLTDGPAVDRMLDPDVSSEDRSRGGHGGGEGGGGHAGTRSLPTPPSLLWGRPVFLCCVCTSGCVPRDPRLPQTATYPRLTHRTVTSPEGQRGGGLCGRGPAPASGRGSGDPGSRPCGACAPPVPDRKPAGHSAAILKHSPALDVSWGAGSGTAWGC